MPPKVAAALAAIGLLSMACLKPEEYPVEPVITLKSFTQQFETSETPGGVVTDRKLFLEVKFTDGDGDIGLDDNYNYPPFDTLGEHYHNMQVRFERFESGQWVDVQSIWDYRIRVITPTGQNKALNGEILLKIGPYPEPRPITLPQILVGDTLRANVWLEDRALHRSSTIVTDAVILANP